jgi:TPR repeat protein
MELGFTEALLGMAGWHMTGADTLLPQNQEMAFYLVKEAAERALARAQYTLGYFYEGGIGTYVNMDLAFKYYELAASQGKTNSLILGEERAIERIKKANPGANITKKVKKRSFFGGIFSKK